MADLHVCPLAHLDAVVARSRATSVVSLLSPDAAPPRLPAAVARHLHLALSDITDPRPGHVLAGAGDVNRLLAFLRGWDRRAPLVIHCYAGVSRSPAAALVALCALDPFRPDHAHAERLRRASPSATPNARLVALADAALARDGRLVAAARAMGRGADCYEGDVFSLPVPDGDAEPDKMG